MLLGLLATALTTAVLLPFAVNLDGRMSSDAQAVAGGLTLGLIIGAVLGTDEGLTSRSLRLALIGSLVGAMVGLIGGLGAGFLGQAIYTGAKSQNAGLAGGWVVFGTILGTTQGVVRRSERGIVAGLAGGAVAGAVGASLAVAFQGWGAQELARTTAAAMPFPLIVGIALALATEVATDIVMVVETGKMRGKRIPLDRRMTTIGRAVWSAGIGISDDPQVAQHHAVIVRQGNHLSVESTPPNVVWINGRNQTAGALKPGDTLRVGSTLFRVEKR